MLMPHRPVRLPCRAMPYTHAVPCVSRATCSWLRRAQKRLGLPADVLTAPGRLPRLYVISSHISDEDFPRYYKVRQQASTHAR